MTSGFITTVTRAENAFSSFSFCRAKAAASSAVLRLNTARVARRQISSGRRQLSKERNMSDPMRKNSSSAGYCSRSAASVSQL